jgi:hypothetical protein
MRSCRVQGCDKFERKRGLRGGTVADDCDYRRVDFFEKNRNAFRVSSPMVLAKITARAQFAGENNLGEMGAGLLPPLSAPFAPTPDRV